MAEGRGPGIGQDENLVEIESDKATVDLAAPVAGTVVQIVHPQGDVVPVGTVIAYLEEAEQAATASPPAARRAVPPAAAASAAPAPASRHHRLRPLLTPAGCGPFRRRRRPQVPRPHNH